VAQVIARALLAAGIATGVVACGGLARQQEPPAPSVMPQPLAIEPEPESEPQPQPQPQPPAPAPVEAPGTRYRCGDGNTVRVLFAGDTVQVEGLTGGAELLLLDAGGLTPQQTVFTSPRLRAEFGLGADGRDAAFHPLQPPGAPVHCRRG
jgi:hypothetical protein